MSKRIAIFLLTLMLGMSSAVSRSTTSPRPIRQTELLSLIAGNALTENIVNEIRARGVAFRMDDSFRAQLNAAGAGPTILTALAAAKPTAPQAIEDIPDPALLQHIATAAKLMKDKHYDQASDQLTATLKGNFEKFEIGFAMGELLRQQENWGQAAAIYTEVLRQDPDFPEAHTKLSYVLYRLGNGVDALREAKAALLRTPQNAEAHKNAGLALHLLGKLDAALAEDQEALRIKPDYVFVRFNIAMLLQDKRDFDGAVAELQKAIPLAPDSADAHYRLGTAFGAKGDHDSELREYREAKRLDPNSYPIRHDLAATFMNLHMYPEAIREFRELEALFPGAELCHLCLGRAFRYIGDPKSSEKELRIAAALEPSDPEPLVTLGDILQDAKEYDAAITEYEKAETRDEACVTAHRGMGTALLAKKNTPGALGELKLAVDLNPSLPYSHYLYAQALVLSGNLDAAVREFKESLTLEAKQANVRLELADALEKKGEWVAALDQYRQAAVDDIVDTTTLRGGTSVRVYGAAKQQKEAQERFEQHLANLRKTGKAAEAAQLERTLRDTQSSASAIQQIDSLVQSGSQSFSERRFDDSERDFKQALQIAENVQPLDGRLANILSHLGQISAFRNDFPAATRYFERQLKVAEELSGSQNPMGITDPLKFLAMSALAQNDVPSAASFVQRALDANEKFYGENSLGFADMLYLMANAYLTQKDHAHAEPYLLHGADIEDKLSNYDAPYGAEHKSLMTLCVVYEKWGKTEKLEACDRRLIAILEKQNSPDTRYLEQSLTREAETLRTLGRPEEAYKVEQRLKYLKPTAAANPN
jgi:tetratricopeptide (TPR) repeat protein